mmetsp:Transcript_83582/g.221394  ORF Transcript_83582/g.221394 Transcript_83582/m.221394 type:complete len:238 (-) Transcript_83582:104-817(-)
MTANEELLATCPSRRLIPGTGTISETVSASPEVLRATDIHIVSTDPADVNSFWRRLYCSKVSQRGSPVATCLRRALTFRKTCIHQGRRPVRRIERLLPDVGSSCTMSTKKISIGVLPSLPLFRRTLDTPVLNASSMRLISLGGYRAHPLLVRCHSQHTSSGAKVAVDRSVAGAELGTGSGKFTEVSECRCSSAGGILSAAAASPPWPSGTNRAPSGSTTLSVAPQLCPLAFSMRPCS